MTSPLERLLLGFWSPLVGLRMILSSRKLILLSMIPLLIGVGIVGLGLMIASEWLGPLLEPLLGMEKLQETSAWLAQILSMALKILYWMLVTVFNFLLGYLCILIVGGPFYGLLVEEVFRRNGVDRPGSGSWFLFFKMIWIGILKVVIFTIIGFICFILAFVPGLNWLAPVIIFAMVAFDCWDYSFEMDALSLRARIQFLFAHGFETMGLIMAIFVTTIVPGAFFIMLPAFICGATKIYIQLSHKPV